MTFPRILSLILFILPHMLTFALAATIQIRNQVSYTVWSAGSIEQHHVDESWTITLAPSTNMGRILGRTSCNSVGDGQNSCLMGSYDGRRRCHGYAKASKAITDFTLKKPKYIDLSLVEGLNIPMEYRPTTNSVPMSYVGHEAATTHAPFFRQRNDVRMMPAVNQRMMREADMPAHWY
ncbi:pathogenesis-related protein R minor form-like [Magnolia sinica]|uniref:pathogenesis-related protein R minor form-like n=1 Tax=Magnolia sinica TaxID=86752 RepID=UPI00265B2D69|nr:pathogenesis-related protein R minor form-like [Magnolia sinica]